MSVISLSDEDECIKIESEEEEFCEPLHTVYITENHEYSNNVKFEENPGFADINSVEPAINKEEPEEILPDVISTRIPKDCAEITKLDERISTTSISKNHINSEERLSKPKQPLLKSQRPYNKETVSKENSCDFEVSKDFNRDFVKFTAESSTCKNSKLNSALVLEILADALTKSLLEEVSSVKLDINNESKTPNLKSTLNFKAPSLKSKHEDSAPVTNAVFNTIKSSSKPKFKTRTSESPQIISKLSRVQSSLQSNSETFPFTEKINSDIIGIATAQSNPVTTKKRGRKFGWRKHTTEHSNKINCHKSFSSVECNSETLITSEKFNTHEDAREGEQLHTVKQKKKPGRKIGWRKNPNQTLINSTSTQHTETTKKKPGRKVGWKKSPNQALSNNSITETRTDENSLAATYIVNTECSSNYENKIFFRNEDVSVIVDSPSQSHNKITLSIDSIIDNLENYETGALKSFNDTTRESHDCNDSALPSFLQRSNIHPQPVTTDDSNISNPQLCSSVTQPKYMCHLEESVKSNMVMKTNTSGKDLSKREKTTKCTQGPPKNNSVNNDRKKAIHIKKKIHKHDCGSVDITPKPNTASSTSLKRGKNKNGSCKLKINQDLRKQSVISGNSNSKYASNYCEKTGNTTRKQTDSTSNGESEKPDSIDQQGLLNIECEIKNSEILTKTSTRDINKVEKPVVDVSVPHSLSSNTSTPCLSTSNVPTPNSDLKFSGNTDVYPEIVKTDFLKCYRKMFDGRVGDLCLKMGDLLLLAMTEDQGHLERLMAAEKLSLRRRERVIAGVSFQRIQEKYRIHFGNMFHEILSVIVKNDTFITQNKNLLLAWFLRVFLRATSLSPEYMDKFHKARSITISLISDYLKNLSVSILRFVYETLFINETEFERNCLLVLGFMQDCCSSESEIDERCTADSLETGSKTGPPEMSIGTATSFKTTTNDSPVDLMLGGGSFVIGGLAERLKIPAENSSMNASVIVTNHNKFITISPNEKGPDQTNNVACNPTSQLTRVSTNIFSSSTQSESTNNFSKEGLSIIDEDRRSNTIVNKMTTLRTSDADKKGYEVNDSITPDNSVQTCLKRKVQLTVEYLTSKVARTNEMTNSNNVQTQKDDSTAAVTRQNSYTSSKLPERSTHASTISSATTLNQSVNTANNQNIYGYPTSYAGTPSSNWNYPLHLNRRMFYSQTARQYSNSSFAPPQNHYSSNTPHVDGNQWYKNMYQNQNYKNDNSLPKSSYLFPNIMNTPNYPRNAFHGHKNAAMQMPNNISQLYPSAGYVQPNLYPSNAPRQYFPPSYQSQYPNTSLNNQFNYQYRKTSSYPENSYQHSMNTPHCNSYHHYQADISKRTSMDTVSQRSQNPGIPNNSIEGVENNAGITINNYNINTYFPLNLSGQSKHNFDGGTNNPDQEKTKSVVPEVSSSEAT